MASEPLYPSKIQKLSPEAIRVTWSDGHEGDYAAEYLRKRCPCASCSNAIRKKTLPVIPAFEQALAGKLEISRVMAMGNYAIGIHFNDGHSTGIYSYEYLRGICPCQHCLRANSLG